MKMTRSIQINLLFLQTIIRYQFLSLSLSLKHVLQSCYEFSRAFRVILFLGFLKYSLILWILQEVEVNLIITDYCMPGMTGYDLLKKIKVRLLTFLFIPCCLHPLFSNPHHLFSRKRNWDQLENLLKFFVIF